MTDTTPGSNTVMEALQPHRSLWRDVWVQFRTHKGALAGAAVFTLILLAVAVGPYLHTVDPTYLDYPAKNLGPSWEHPFGTDNLGRDMLAQVLAGGRVSMAVGFTAMALSLLVGVAVGVLAGVFPPARRAVDADDRPVFSAAAAAAAVGHHHAVPRYPSPRLRAGDRHLPADRFRHRHHVVDADGADRARRRVRTAVTK